jgi:DNA polymerase III delta prime subunit
MAAKKTNKNLAKLCVVLANPAANIDEVIKASQKISDFNELTEQNFPPLLYAIMSDRKDFVNFLLNKGADINLPLPSGKTLLACAISYKEDRTDMARYLLSRGANPFSIQEDDYPKHMNPTIRYWLKRARNRRKISKEELEFLKKVQISRLLEMEMTIVGQVQATTMLIKRMRSFYIDRENRPKPLVIIFAGPPGSGKTFLASNMGEMLEIPFLKVACEKAKSDFEFFGANAPYVGSADGTPLNNFICQNAGKPSVVLLDEFDKTVNTVWLRALNIFEKGEWEDTRSRKPVNCSKTVFILTANCADQVIVERFNKPVKLESERDMDMLSDKVEEAVFPIIRNNFGEPFQRRVDCVIPFLPVYDNEEKIVLSDTKLRDEWVNKWKKPPNKERHIGNMTIHVHPAVVEFIAGKYSITDGAKSFDRVIDRIQAQAADRYFQGHFPENEIFVEMENGIPAVNAHQKEDDSDEESKSGLDKEEEITLPNYEENCLKNETTNENSTKEEK